MGTIAAVCLASFCKGGPCLTRWLRQGVAGEPQEMTAASLTWEFELLLTVRPGAVGSRRPAIQRRGSRFTGFRAVARLP